MPNHDVPTALCDPIAGYRCRVAAARGVLAFAELIAVANLQEELIEGCGHEPVVAALVTALRLMEDTGKQLCGEVHAFDLALVKHGADIGGRISKPTNGDG